MSSSIQYLYSDLYVRRKTKVKSAKEKNGSTESRQESWNEKNVFNLK